ncbi:manganese efflux pump [Viridibacillus sp. YIM B01967]|uniref:Manganese efflux pump n=1 Tax=Viridibacillus soli TaxID=2798301 RepID=A0ABS1HA03_9BACL|nr:manganese efflux pump [Viridibacillus soli]MBK3496250.1 manganese efflux pump [Viridibacillus soli]
MHWITIILIGIAANIDNLGVGLAYGMKQTNIPILSNITIAIVSMIITYVAVIAGAEVIKYISPHNASLVGSFLLCGIGLWTLLSNIFSRKKPLENPEMMDRDRNRIISVKEAVPLGFALSANCLAGGIGIGANGISAMWTVISIGFFSVVMIGAGSHFGCLLQRSFISKYATAFSGLMLIGIGVFEMFN